MSQDKCFFDREDFDCKIGMMSLDIVFVLLVSYLINKANVKISKIKSPCVYCTTDAMFDETYSIFSLWLVIITKYMLYVLIILRIFDLYVVFAHTISNGMITNLFLVFSYTN